jgi:hypothetical protein
MSSWISPMKSDFENEVESKRSGWASFDGVEAASIR